VLLYLAQAPLAFALASIVASIVTADGTSTDEPITRAPHGSNETRWALPFPVEFVVVAHQDDWQLFQGNQTASSARPPPSGDCLRDRR